MNTTTQMLKNSSGKNNLVNAMDRIVVDEKGLPSINTTDSPLVDVSLFLRDTPRSEIQEKIKTAIETAEATGRSGNDLLEVQTIVDLFKIAAHIRDIDDGKGERRIFYWYLIELARYYPNTVKSLLPLIPDKYGSYLDFNMIIQILDKDLDNPNDSQTVKRKITEFRQVIIDLFVDRLNQARTTYKNITSGKGGKLDLVAKWAPSEGSQFDDIAKEIAVLIFSQKPVLNPDGSIRFQSLCEYVNRGASAFVIRNARRSCYMRYRKMLTKLRKELKIIEQKMCSEEGLWHTIDFSGIPAKALNKYRNAIRNLSKSGEQRSDLQDRIDCAEAFEAHLTKCRENPKEARVHGSKLMPHEMVKKYLRNSNGFNSIFGTSEDPVIEAQWIDLIQRLKESGDLTNAVPMIDVSGSMYPDAIHPAIALGLVLSEVSTTFKDRFITFESEPQWVNLDGRVSLFDRTAYTVKAKWGGSTNIEAALKLIQRGCIDAKMSYDEVANLTFFIFSDMQFDQADGNGYYTTFSNKYDRIVKSWNDVGFPVPKLVFWDLRNTGDHPASADIPGVTMISGFSASLLKGFLNGTLLEEANKPPLTAYEVLRRTIDAERYDMVGQVCANSDEIVSKTTGLRYTMPAREAEAEAEASEPEAEAAAATSEPSEAVGENVTLRDMAIHIKSELGIDAEYIPYVIERAMQILMNDVTDGMSLKQQALLCYNQLI